MKDARVPPPLVVIGGSAGAIRPLRGIVAGLPADLPAAVCVVIHIPDDSPSALAGLLARAGPMDARFANDGLPLEASRIAVAPPGFHLLVHGRTLTLSHEPREHGTRPAIDPLFRSAARALGPDVVSVVLSGTLDDGAAGTAAVRSAGGLTIVQDPSDAEFPDMPRHAIETGQVVERLPAAAMPALIRAAVEQITQRRLAFHP